MAIIEKKLKIPEDLKRCVEFHGHIYPQLSRENKVVSQIGES